MVSEPLKASIVMKNTNPDKVQKNPEEKPKTPLGISGFVLNSEFIGTLINIWCFFNTLSNIDRDLPEHSFFKFASQGKPLFCRLVTSQ